MTNEEAQYVFIHYLHFLQLRESLAWKHYRHSADLYGDPDGARREGLYLRTGWLSSDPQVLALLSKGYDQFVLDCANKIMEEHANKVIFNRCPKCDKLARTPLAKQCRHCGLDWH